jgi:hypothetical protein
LLRGEPSNRLIEFVYALSIESMVSSSSRTTDRAEANFFVDFFFELGRLDMGLLLLPIG